jgi:hypothetical protein
MRERKGFSFIRAQPSGISHKNKPAKRMAKIEIKIPISINLRLAGISGLMAGIIVLIADRKTIIFDGRIAGFAVVFGLPDSLVQIPGHDHANRKYEPASS